MKSINYKHDVTSSVINSRVNLCETVSAAGVELKRSGNRLKGLCPFHSEKTASFFVFPDNRFKCFGCGVSGNAIDFVQKMHGVSFLDALKYLGIKQGPVTADVKKQIRQRKRKAELVKRFRRWEMRKADQAAEIIRCIHKVAATWKGPDDLEREGEVLEMLPKHEHELDVLCSRDDRLKFQLLTGLKGPTPFDLGQALASFEGQLPDPQLPSDDTGMIFDAMIENIRNEDPYGTENRIKISFG